MVPTGKKNGGDAPLDGVLLNNHHQVGIMNLPIGGIVIGGVGLFQVAPKTFLATLQVVVAVGIFGK